VAREDKAVTGPYRVLAVTEPKPKFGLLPGLFEKHHLCAYPGSWRTWFLSEGYVWRCFECGKVWRLAAVEGVLWGERLAWLHVSDAAWVDAGGEL
jgi:hypothetical protein